MDAENVRAYKKIFVGLFFEQMAPKGGQDAGEQSPEVSLSIHRLGVTPFTFKGLTISRVNKGQIESSKKIYNTSLSERK